eukprot:TRINITY_DN40557_c0_g1_i1.p1 TRINITY_DN40557_c0_g1~~TRINITY_DN40557_c0_g1_i1.p1  ORF type:complete len:442 (-),score=77.17 TRINITY_DN40557_c0_g1_i1:73-1398(-)
MAVRKSLLIPLSGSLDKSASSPHLMAYHKQPPSPSSPGQMPSPQGFQALQRDVDHLKQQLSESRTSLSEMRRASEMHRARAEAIRGRVRSMEQGRIESQAEVASLSKLQLAEIKQLCNRPPEIVRRVLSACWILLHVKRFDGKKVVHFDERRDWRQCQKMLSDESFVDSILNYDSAPLQNAPHVLAHLRLVCFGLREPDEDSNPQPTCQGGASVPPSPSPSMQSSPPSSPMLPRPSRSSSLCSLAPRRSSGRLEVPSAASRSSSRSSGRSSSRCSSRSAASEIVPLDMHAVTFACQPCGALFRWMQDILMHQRELERARSELVEIDAALVAAEEREHLALQRTRKLEEIMEKRQARLGEAEVLREQESKAALRRASTSFKCVECGKFDPSGGCSRCRYLCQGCLKGELQSRGKSMRAHDLEEARLRFGEQPFSKRALLLAH